MLCSLPRSSTLPLDINGAGNCYYGLQCTQSSYLSLCTAVHDAGLVLSVRYGPTEATCPASQLQDVDDNDVTFFSCCRPPPQHWYPLHSDQPLPQGIQFGEVIVRGEVAFNFAHHNNPSKNPEARYSSSSIVVIIMDLAQHEKNQMFNGMMVVTGWWWVEEMLQNGPP